MCASGIDKLTPEPQHALKMCLLAQKMMKTLNDLDWDSIGVARLQMRIGVASGAVATGVIGTVMPYVLLMVSAAYLFRFHIASLLSLIPYASAALQFSAMPSILHLEWRAVERPAKCKSPTARFSW